MKHIAIINPDSSQEIQRNLIKLDIEPFLLPKTPLVAEPISGHPDIQLFPMGKTLFCHPDIDKTFIRKIDNYCEIIMCDSRLAQEYPHDIWYNIALTGDHAFHFRPYTDKTIVSHLTAKNIIIINIKQGYAKCSTMIIDENSIITADTMINQKGREHGLDSLLIRPGFIELPGYTHGFIGGASSQLHDRVFFTGHLQNHPDKNKIIQFIEQKAKKIIYLSTNTISDLGSIFILGI